VGGWQRFATHGTGTAFRKSVRALILNLLFFSGFAVAAPVEIPFRIFRGMILVEAGIAGSPRPLQFILDSGAGATVFAKDLAADLDLPLTAGERIRTVNGTQDAGRAETTHLQLGSPSNSLRFSPSPLVVDLRKESKTLGTRIDGLLGADLFAGRSIKIDFKKSRLHLSPAGKPGLGSTRLPLEQSGGAMFVGLTAGNALLPRVRLDTGCSRSLCWSPPDGSLLRGYWRDGQSKTIEVNFGPRVMAEVATDLYRRPLFVGEDGLLGTALLSRFDSVWIDSIQHRITFESPRER